MKKRKVILIISLSLIAAVIGWQVIQRIVRASLGSDQERRSMPIAVEVQEVKKDSIRDVGNFMGSLIPKSQFTVAPKISGRLEKLLVNIGDRVEQDQLIAVLDDEEYSQQVRQAEADLLVTEANLEESLSSWDMAKRELERVEELHRRGISADSELDAAKGAAATQEARYKVAQAQVVNRKAALESAKIRLSYTKIQASWEEKTGYRVVGERFVDEGAMLTPNSSILSILEINPLLAVIHITDKDYFRLEKGQKAVISTDAVPDQAITGEVMRIAPLLKETSREARIEIEIPNQKEIFKPGMFVNVQIEFAVHEEVTVVPVSSVVKRMDKEGIFLADMENKTAIFVPVKTGVSSKDMVEIIEPASVSGYVVTLGQHLLAHGSPIMLPGSPSEEEGKGDALKSGEKR
ncbi:MAG: efflux RND transporter periplasmic adaptor subunit [Candidatus Aminicenantes bacterium]|nr:efflux RND transporter periplasmic adaptor subunit [Candidatus Aminicenantes bacterium]